MCASRLQRLLTAFVVALAAVLFNLGLVAAGTGILVFVVAMLVLWALTNFCPSLWLFRRFFPPCSWES